VPLWECPYLSLQILADKKGKTRNLKGNLNQKAYIPTGSLLSYCQKYFFFIIIIIIIIISPEIFLSLQRGGRLENYSQRTDTLPSLFPHILRQKNQCTQIVVTDISFIICSVVAAKSDYAMTW